MKTAPAETGTTCRHCGARLRAGAARCPGCEGVVRGDPSGRIGQAAAAGHEGGPVRRGGATLPVVPAAVAPVGRRVGALLLDQLIALMSMVVVVVVWLATQLPTGMPLLWALLAVLAVVEGAQTVAEAVTGATAAGAALGLRTVGATTGLPAGLIAVLVRRLVLLVGFAAGVVGSYVVAASGAWDSGAARRGWHDKAAGTMVLLAWTVPTRAERARAGQGQPVVTAPAPGAGAAPSPSSGSVRTATVPTQQGPRGPRAAVAAPRPGAAAASPSARIAVPSAARAASPSLATVTAPSAVSTRGAVPSPAAAGTRAASAPRGTPLPHRKARAATVTDPPSAPPSDATPVHGVPTSAPATIAASKHVRPEPGRTSSGGSEPRGTSSAAPQQEPREPGTPDRPWALVPWPGAAEPTPGPRLADEVELTRLTEPVHRQVLTTARVRLEFDTGERVDVVDDGAVGRDPAFTSGASAHHQVAIVDPERSVSRLHLLFGPDSDGARLWVTDPGSTNGTVLVDPSGAAMVLAPGVRAVVGPGWLIQFGGRTAAVVAVG